MRHEYTVQIVDVCGPVARQVSAPVWQVRGVLPLLLLFTLLSQQAEIHLRRRLRHDW